MNSEQRLKIQWNFTNLVDGLLVDEIADNLYTESVIEHDDLQRVNAEKTDRDKASCLINILITSENSFEPFLKEVESSRPDLAEKLKQTDVEEELRKEKEDRIQFLCNIVRKRYRFVEDKSVLEEDMLNEITFEYWKTKKKLTEQEIQPSLIECIQKLFPEAIRKKGKRKGKKVWKYCNLGKTELETSEEEEESCTDTESIHAKDEFISTKDDLETTEKHLPLMQFKDLKTPAMKYVLAPYFEKDGIESRFLEVFDREKIDGEVFADCDMDDLDRLFKDMPYGDKKRLFNIKKSILKEESSAGPFLQIAAASCQGIEDTEVMKSDLSVGQNEGDEYDPETKFKEIFRTFDTSAKAVDAYRKHAVFRTSNLFISDLIEPLHCFRHRIELDQSILMKWIAEETVKFAGACFSDRTNGTIHFGISEICDADGHLEGKVVGLQINQSKFLDVFYEEIKASFYKDQLSIVLQCLRPPQFVKVHHKELTNEKQLFVVEVDIVPNFNLTTYDTFYLKLKNEKNESVPRIYKFEKNVPKVLLDDDLKDYMAAKIKIANNRKYTEMSSLPSNVYENLREQFLNFYTAGNDKLTNDIYPILFLSPLDSAMSEDFVSENFAFLLNIEPSAIFDFHSSLDKKCLYNFVDADQERVVKVYTTDNFDRSSEENANSSDKLNNVLEELRTSQLKPWIFCNGYEPLQKPPLNRLEWKKRRSEGFKEVTRFLQQEIPNERALVIFLIFSKNYDIMLEVAEEVILKFQNQWIAMSENEKLIENWRDELLRRDSVDKKTLKERCIIGLPWRHLNNIVKEVSTSLSMASKCQLPTSAGAFCYLKDKIRNELCDLEILSANECENYDICKYHDKLEKHRQLVEETFYRGGEVTWWNLHFEDDHVLLRSQQERIQESIEKLLKPKQRVDDTRVPCFKLFHQPGAGGTTTAHHTLWRFRKNYRCAIVRKITDQTCNQIERLRCFEDLDNPKPPIILIDNGDEEKIQDLCSRLEYKARTTGKNDLRTIYCLLFLCVRRANLPLYTETNTVQLKHELSQKELDWLKRKYQSLNERFKNNEGVNPKLLISFNILKENFDAKYIERTVKEFVDSIDVDQEIKLIKYLSLINSYDIDFQSVPLSAFDPLMAERKDNVIISMGSVTGMRQRPSNLRRNWEQTLRQSTEVLLNRNARILTGGQALSIISKLFAKAILAYIVGKENVSIGNVMIECLCCPMFIAENASTRMLKRIIQDVLKKREFTADQKKEMFSPIILEIAEKEGKDKAAEVLETGYDITKDPMLAQQIARFYIDVANWEKAEQYAQFAVKSKPDNSYLWDTFGQIYKKRLTERYKNCIANDTPPTDSEMKDFIKLAMKGLANFTKEQIVSENSTFGRENDAGYFGEVRLIVQLLDLLNLWFPKEDKTELHAYLVNLDNPATFQNFSEESRRFLKNLYSRSEKTMQVIEDKLAQLKNEREGDVFTQSAIYNPRHELVQLRENLDNYLGEQTSEIPENLSPEATASFIRRRVKRIGGRSCSSILDLRSSPDGEKKLDEMSSKLMRNIDSKFSNAYDYVTLITVTLVKQMTHKTFPEEGFRNLVEWSKMGYEMTLRLREDERPQLEAFMYFVMIHWPTESKRKFKLCPIETVEEAIRKWKQAFYKMHSKEKDEAYSFRRRVTTYYFLGKGSNSKEIVYYKDLKCKQTNLDGEAMWRSKPVKDKLQQLRGTLLSDGWEIMYTFFSKAGNKSSIRVRNSYPSPKSLWQKSVVFYLGFSWSGPKAYIQIDSTPSEGEEQSYNPPMVLCSNMQLQGPVLKQGNSGKQKKTDWQDVATHEAYLQSLRKINAELKEIESFKNKKKCTQKQREQINKEKRLLEERKDLVLRRCQFVDRSNVENS